MMYKYAISKEDNSLMRDVSFEEFEIAQAEGKAVWISTDDGPYIMQIG